MENLLQDEIETILEIRRYLEAHEEKIRIIRQKVDEIDSARVRYFVVRNHKLQLSITLSPAKKRKK